MYIKQVYYFKLIINIVSMKGRSQIMHILSKNVKLWFFYILSIFEQKF